MNKIPAFCYKNRHFLALGCMLLSIYIIKEVTVYLYFYSGNNLNLFDVIKALWQTNRVYFQFLAIINFVIKPLFVYYLVIVILSLYFQKHKNE